MTVLAIGTRRSNAEAVADCAELGYVAGVVVDVTYGRGRWWTRHRPAELVAHDLALDGVDFRNLPEPDGYADTVAFDPPYKLNGTSTGRGPSALDEGYGVADGYRSIEGRYELVRAGLGECVRILKPRGHLLLKCHDQVSSGRFRWQSRLFAEHAETLGCVVVDRLHVRGRRAQPPERRQVHVHADYSTLLVLRRSSS